MLERPLAYVADLQVVLEDVGRGAVGNFELQAGLEGTLKHLLGILVLLPLASRSFGHLLPIWKYHQAEVVKAPRTEWRRDKGAAHAVFKFRRQVPDAPLCAFAFGALYLHPLHVHALEGAVVEGHIDARWRVHRCHRDRLARLPFGNKGLFDNVDCGIDVRHGLGLRSRRDVLLFGDVTLLHHLAPQDLVVHPELRHIVQGIPLPVLELCDFVLQGRHLPPQVLHPLREVSGLLRGNVRVPRGACRLRGDSSHVLSVDAVHLLQHTFGGPRPTPVAAQLLIDLIRSMPCPGVRLRRDGVHAGLRSGGKTGSARLRPRGRPLPKITLAGGAARKA
mmetsp:Transcript_82172/g.229046  ORF Transcript_82172/g.229046 Transcript_82172/m.229046 type:complete len:334 (-) Transcript_82172:2-1003(-)